MNPLKLLKDNFTRTVIMNFLFIFFSPLFLTTLLPDTFIVFVIYLLVYSALEFTIDVISIHGIKNIISNYDEGINENIYGIRTLYIYVTNVAINFILMFGVSFNIVFFSDNLLFCLFMILFHILGVSQLEIIIDKKLFKL